MLRSLLKLTHDLDSATTKEQKEALSDKMVGSFATFARGNEVSITRKDDIEFIKSNITNDDLVKIVAAIKGMEKRLKEYGISDAHNKLNDACMGLIKPEEAVDNKHENKKITLSESKSSMWSAGKLKKEKQIKIGRQRGEQKVEDQPKAPLIGKKP